MIELLPHNPEWISFYEQIKKTVWPQVQEFSVSIEHVGSTSIPGLVAKPVVDMVVIVNSEANSKKAIQALTKLGYEHRGDLGIKGREAFRKPPHLAKHHLYVVMEGSVSLKNHLLFKKHMLENQQARIQYSELKKSLAEKYSNDIDSYCFGKTSFILSILKQQGMTEVELQEILAANSPTPATLV